MTLNTDQALALEYAQDVLKQARTALESPSKRPDYILGACCQEAILRLNEKFV